MFFYQIVGQQNNQEFQLLIHPEMYSRARFQEMYVGALKEARLEKGNFVSIIDIAQVMCSKYGFKRPFPEFSLHVNNYTDCSIVADQIERRQLI